MIPRCRRQTQAASALPQLRVTASVAGRQGMRTRRVMCPLASQQVLLLARKGSSGAGWMLPSTSNARDVTLCSPGAGRPPVERPEPPGVAARPSRAVAGGIEPRRLSRVRCRFGPPPPRSARPRRRRGRRTGFHDVDSVRRDRIGTDSWLTVSSLRFPLASARGTDVATGYKFRDD